MWTGMSVSDSQVGQAGGSRADDVAAGRDRAAAALLERLERLRDEISQCDRELIETLARRRGLVREIGKVKAHMGFPVTDPRREAAVVRRAAEMARAAGLDEELIRNLIWKIMSSSRVQQYRPSEEGKAPGTS